MHNAQACSALHWLAALLWLACMHDSQIATSGHPCFLHSYTACDLHRERDAWPFHDTVSQHRKAGSRIRAVASAPWVPTGPPWAACSAR